jgi:cell division protein DivIC
MLKKIPNWLKNKYVLTSIIFAVYFLFLDDWDIFTLVRQKRKLSQIEQQDEQMHQQLRDTKKTLRKLHRVDELEAYARSEKFFKRDDEEIFVITKE